MYLAYSELDGVAELKPGFGLGCWLMPELVWVNFGCNWSVWMVPGTVDPMED